MDNDFKLNNEVIFKERKRIVFFALPLSFTVYKLSESLLTISKGLLNKIEDDCYMYKIQDVKLSRSLFERLFKLGTIICYTGDITHSEIRLTHIKNANEIKAFILEASEEARRKRRVLSTLDIGADMDGIAE